MKINHAFTRAQLIISGGQNGKIVSNHFSWLSNHKQNVMFLLAIRIWLRTD